VRFKIVGTADVLHIWFKSHWLNKIRSVCLYGRCKCMYSMLYFHLWMRP